jgi:N-acetylglutamate synthase-like GNAT family acetyltransferase
MQVRVATSSDLPAIHRVHLRAARGPDSLQRHDPAANAWLDKRSLADYAREMSREHFVVAEEDSRIVGFGALDLDKHEITSVYVDPSFTRRGVGRALVAALERTAAAAGLKELRLQAAGGALVFYEKNGYDYLSRPKARPAWADMVKELW